MSYDNQKFIIPKCNRYINDKKHYCKKFIWNHYHKKLFFEQNISNIWAVELIHGFIAQNS